MGTHINGTTTTTTTTTTSTAKTSSSTNLKGYGVKPTSDKIETELIYVKHETNDGKRHYTLVNAVPGGERPTNSVNDVVKTTVYNLRGQEGNSHIDITGFQVLHAPSQFKDFDNKELIESDYYKEVVDLIKEQTGASRVFVFDHTIRKSGADDTTPDSRKPVSRAHVDQTTKAAIERVHRHMGEDAPGLLKKRFQIINVWRPFANPAYEFPLAFADGRTVSSGDLIPSALVYPTHEGETFAMAYNPNVNWYYVKDMKEDEVVFLKCYDSKPDVTKTTPHTAFDNGRKDVPKRQSIEIRTLVFYD